MSEDPIIVELHEPVTLPDGRARLSCAVRVDSTTTHEVWMHVPREAAPGTDDWAVPLMVVPAMRACRPLRIVGRVSPVLLEGVARAQQVLTGFDPQWRAKPVTADQLMTQPPVSPARAASFFSAGVDSWYTALTGDAEDVAFGIGIDMRPEDRERIAMVVPAVRAAAAALGKPMTEFETNLRELYYGTRAWGRHYQGAALASCALALSGRYSRFLIPATHGEADLGKLWGSCPALDPLWSSPAMRLIHHGVLSRVEKARLLADHDGAMATLRVCWSKEVMQYNCCRCGKCLRTMMALALANGLDRCRTFPLPLDLAAVAAMPYDPVGSSRLRTELLMGAAKDPKHADLLRALCENVVRSAAPPTAGAEADAEPKRGVSGKVGRRIARVLRRLAAWMDP